jgi:uncharacterized protein
MKKIIAVFKVIVITYIALVCLLYFFQEEIIFHPQKLEMNHRFDFDEDFKEKNIKTKDGSILNGLLFKTEKAKGLIFYLHGNAGSLDGWGEVAATYTSMGYDVFMLDYRGYGKSESVISSEKQCFDDVQIVYEELKKEYKENEIIVLGYSVGTGMAAKVASVNNPKLLILQAPYYSLVDMLRHNYAIIPSFILKYKFETNNFLKNCKMPIVIFHGDADQVIYYGSSVKLQSEFKITDKLITLKGQGHNRMNVNQDYLNEMRMILK